MTQEPKIVPMTYTHLCAWRVIGGISLPPDLKTVKLVSSPGWAYSLINDIDTACAATDRGAALVFLAMQGIFSPAKIESLERRLAESVQDIQKNRREKAGSYPFLFFRATGSIDVKLSHRAHEHNDCVLTVDAFDKEAISHKFAPQHRALQLALALVSKTRVRFDDTTSGTYCTNEEARTFYSLSFVGGRPDVTVGSPLVADAAGSVAQRFDFLNTCAEFDSVIRLYSDMARYGREPLRAFLSGWTALEILINKIFNSVEEHFFRSVSIPHQPEMSMNFLDCVRETMKGKHSLVNRFTLLSSVLLPAQAGKVAEADLSTFKRIKRLRDEITHGSTIDEEDLPVDELSQLLLKYLNARAEWGLNAAATPISRRNENRNVRP